MLRKSILLLLGLVCVWTFCAAGQDISYSDKLFSPSVALKFYELGYELSNKPAANITTQTIQSQQALLFFTAATKLDNQAGYILPDMMKIAANTPAPLLLGLPYRRALPKDVNDPNAAPPLPPDNTELVRTLLRAYVKSTVDLQIAKEAIDYLLGQMDSREQKEQQIRELLATFKNKNDVLESDLLTSLGMLILERADVNSAQAHFFAAIDKNKYNRVAFAKIYELSEGWILPAAYLSNLRYMLGENPLDIETAVAFASYAERLQLFELAADGYEYCASLYEYLYPQQPLPRYIYLGLALNAYNTDRHPHKPVHIAEKLQKYGVVDLVLQTVAAKAATKTGQTEKAQNILAAAEQEARAKYQTDPEQRQAIAEQLAWFYCFGSPQPGQAIDWANKAYSNEPNNVAAASLLAYAFVMNKQAEWAKPFLESYQSNPVLDLTKARIELAERKTDLATQTLTSVIESAPASIEAHEAKRMLNETEIEYVPSTDPGVIETALEGTFGSSSIVPAFRGPNEIIDAQLNIRGHKFGYGTDFGASLVITNLSPEPVVISDYGLFKGNIRIDAVITGDLDKGVSNLVTKRILPSSPIGPSSSLIVPLRLMSGQLREFLAKHPQASLEIEFMVYLDPVALPDGSTGNRLKDLKVVKKKVKRPAVELSAQFLRNRMNTLKRKRQSYRTAELFAGLLVEQHVMAKSEPKYRFMYADWMPEILKSSLVFNLTDDQWDGRIHTMVALLPLPLDFELLEAVSENLNNENWPVRLMAIYLLAQNQDSGFKQVLDYTAKYDSYELIRDMAVALGADKLEERATAEPQL
jgi:hypothetical protein